MNIELNLIQPKKPYNKITKLDFGNIPLGFSSAIQSMILHNNSEYQLVYVRLCFDFMNKGIIFNIKTPYNDYNYNNVLSLGMLFPQEKIDFNVTVRVSKEAECGQFPISIKCHFLLNNNDKTIYTKYMI